jgi:hypothetical protein
MLGDWWSHAPVLTAIAIVSLGATDLTIERFRRSAAYFPILLLHALTYACLFGAMAGARIQATASGVDGVSGWILADLATSIVPMSLAFRAIAAALQGAIVPRY